MDTTETSQYTVKEELIVEEELNIPIKNELDDEQVENTFENDGIEVKKDYSQNEQDEKSTYAQSHAEIIKQATEAYIQSIEQDILGITEANQSKTLKDVEFQHIVKDNFKMEIEELTEEENNPFIQTIHTHVEKENLKMEIETDNQFLQIEKDNLISIGEQTGMNDEIESILPTNDEKIKEEVVHDSVDDINLTSYEYPSFDDSMDSSEAAALSQVEACLSEEVIKPDRDYNEREPKIIKEERDLNVTETHIISNKVINTTSTLTNTHDGIIQSQTTQTLVMQIQPVSQTMNIGHPEEILPTNNDNYNLKHYEETFQLNSITGNYLSLEQEAYGLLQTKKQKLITDKVYQCSKCEKTYAQKRGMVRHYKIHEGIERRELGIIKGLKTKRDKKNRDIKDIKLKIKKEDKKEVVKREVLEKPRKEGYPCTCGQVFRRNSRMETCLKSHTYSSDVEFKCSSCDKKFKTNQDLIYHRNHHHRKRYPCKFCPTNYNTQKALFKHLQIHQQVQLTEFKVIIEVTKKKLDLNCIICNKNSPTLSELKKHIMEDHKVPYRCRHCKKQFPKLTEFINHIKQCHAGIENQSLLDVIEAFSKLVKAWKCDSCGIQFHEADKLAIHQMDDHTLDMKNEQHFQCEDCQRVFVSIQGLHSHRRMHHRPEETEPTEPEEVGVMCLECRKICPDMTALTSHMRLHSLERKYPCKFCDFRFSTPQKRKKHSEIHTGDMKYVCFICEYQCSSENRLKHHKMSVKHLSMKEYLLTGKPIIEEPTKKEKDRKRDSVKKKKKDKKDREVKSDDFFVCDICGERFECEDAMSDHKQTHPFIEFPNEKNPSRIFFK